MAETQMYIIMITWEYPPKTIGEISDHVFNLISKLTQKNHQVELVVDDNQVNKLEKKENLNIHRVVNPVNIHYGASILSSAMTGSVRIEQETSDIIYYYRERKISIDLVHAHEWLSIQPAISLKYAFDLPFVLTLYSLEGHRCHDDFGPLSIAISDIEKTGIAESDKTIVLTQWMKKEVIRYYGEENRHKIEIVPIAQLSVHQLIDIYKNTISE